MEEEFDDTFAPAVHEDISCVKKAAVSRAPDDRDYDEDVDDDMPIPRNATTRRDFAKDETYNRKDKSLSLLCEKFYEVYLTSNDSTTIYVDQAAQTLKVGRRRIYDIVNVLESLKFAERRQKNCYVFHGQNCVNNALGRLLFDAIVDCVAHGYPSWSKDIWYTSVSSPTPEQTVFAELADKRREKLLGNLCEHFVQLMMLFDNKTISLDDVKLLFGCKDDATSQEKKTRTRRLYDVANILMALKLTRKHMGSSCSGSSSGGGKKKAVFDWTLTNITPVPPEDWPSDIPVPTIEHYRNQFRSNRNKIKASVGELLADLMPNAFNAVPSDSLELVCLPSHLIPHPPRAVVNDPQSSPPPRRVIQHARKENEDNIPKEKTSAKTLVNLMYSLASPRTRKRTSETLNTLCK